MRLIFLATVVGLMATSMLYAQPKAVKKIEIIETNNLDLSIQKNSLLLPDSIQKLENLRSYILKDFKKPNMGGEFTLFIGLMQWVSKQWKHDGWNAAPPEMTSLEILEDAKQHGTRYRCAEYGKVLNDALISFGYVARKVGLTSMDAEYGGVGKSHAATEVWCNDLGKWVFLDPQFGIWAEYEHTPLNIYDIYLLKSQGKFEAVEFLKYEDSKLVRSDSYPKFLTNYLGYFDVKMKEGDKVYRKTLMMEEQKQALVFQGFPLGNIIYTKDYNEVYFRLNEIAVIIDFTKKEYDRCNVELAKIKDKITDEETYNEHLYRFVARPDLMLFPINDIPWFKEYEVSLNGKRIESENGYYYFSLDEGINEIKVVGKNEMGIRTPETLIKIRYQ